MKPTRKSEPAPLHEGDGDPLRFSLSVGDRSSFYNTVSYAGNELGELPVIEQEVPPEQKVTYCKLVCHARFAFASSAGALAWLNFCHMEPILA